MSRALLAIIAVGIVFYAGEASVTAGPIPRSVSTSRQFIAFGADAQLRGALCDVAERTKQNALRVLQVADQWSIPIVVNAQFPQANLPELPPARLNLSQTGAGLKLQLDLSIGADVSGPAVERELLRAVFLEIIYRAAPNTPAGTAYVEPLDWLLEGVLALTPTRDPAGIAEALSAPVASDSIMPLEALLAQRLALLDAPSRVLYRAYSAALVSMLTDAPGGHRLLARFVVDLPQSTNDPMADLKAHFPVLRDDARQLQKRWSLSVARLSATGRYRLLGCEETERQLAQLLRIELREGEQGIVTYSLEEFAKFIRIPASRNAFQKLTQDLLLLSGRANPLYRPVIGDYREIVALLARGKTKKVSSRLAELRGTREHISRRMGAIADYMNWFEVTQSQGVSGAFRDYMRAADAATEREPRRSDPISVYLDALESQFQD